MHCSICQRSSRAVGDVVDGDKRGDPTADRHGFRRSRKKVGYTSILVESFVSFEPGHRYPIAIRPLPDQPCPPTLVVECAMEMRSNYAVGTAFRVRVPPKQETGCRPHLYSYHGWRFEVVKVPVEN